MSSTVPQSLIDRLIDDAPSIAYEPIEDADAALTRYKLGLRRDLEALLNSRRPYSPWLERSGDVSDSILGFGLPDLSTEDFATPAVRDRVRRMIAQCIRTFEPRLSKVDVEVDGAPTSAGMRFRITANLNLTVSHEAVTYDANVRPSDRVIAVHLPG